MKLKNHAIFLCFFILIGTQIAQGKTRNVLIEETQEVKLGIANPVLINDLIIYQTIENNEYSLWSFDTNTSEKQLFFTGQLNRSYQNKYLHVINDIVYFVSGLDSNKKFMRSDGSVAGTFALDSSPVFHRQRQIENLLFAASINNSLISTDGNLLFEHNILYPRVDDICAFGVYDVIVAESDPYTAETTIKRSRANQISILSESLVEHFFIYSMEKFGDNCFIRIGGPDQFREILIIPQDGEVMQLSQMLDITGVRRIFNFKNRVYVFQSDDYGSESKILRLTADFSGFDAEFSAPEYNVFNALTASDDFIIASTITSVASPSIRIVYYLDENLVHNDSLGGAFAPVPVVYPLLDSELFVTRSFQPRNRSETLSFELTPTPSTSLTIRDATLLNVITRPDSPLVYMMVQDKVFGNKSISILADVPDIGETITGIWNDPEIKSQGLVINKGHRSNGSKYLFVTVFTFRDGKPFWLAGVADISLAQKSINVPLSSYDGTNLFEAGTTPQQNVFGNINLMMTSCNTLKATISSAENESYLLNLIRIDNSLFDHLCSE